jgi:hypothetical protein
MQATAAQAGVGTQAGSQHRAAIAARLPDWIQSPRYDLLLLLLVPLIPVPVLLLADSHPTLMLVAGFVLGFAHYMSTFTFFAWDEYRDRHRARKAAFFGGPLLIVVMMGVLARVPLVIPVVLFFWNVVHVARQSSGVASVYRHRAGVADPVDKQVANAAILSGSVALALANIESHRQVLPVLTWLAPGGALLAKLGAGAVALVCLVRLFARLRARAREAGSAPRVPELASLACALALFHPYLWVDDSGLATAGMLLGHYVQYLSIVWLVHHRRFSTVAGSAPQRALAYVSQRRGLVLGVLAVVGLGFLGGYQLSYRLGLGGYFEGMYLTIAFVHFYLDGLFWAFKDPTVRRSLAPYLTGFRLADSAAA